MIVSLVDVDQAAARLEVTPKPGGAAPVLSVVGPRSHRAEAIRVALVATTPLRYVVRLRERQGSRIVGAVDDR